MINFSVPSHEGISSNRLHHWLTSSVKTCRYYLVSKDSCVAESCVFSSSSSIIKLNFWLLPKIHPVCWRRYSKNTTFGNCRKCTAKVSTAIFMFPQINTNEKKYGRIMNTRNFIDRANAICSKYHHLHIDTKGCFISFDPLFIFLLSLPYSIVERYWIYIFEEQHLSYRSKKNHPICMNSKRELRR
jgi:hypothetical protein